MRQYHLEDRLTWQAIRSGHAVSSAEALAENDVFVRDFLNANGLAHAAAAPLKAPIVAGYAGAIHVYRTAEQGPFTADEVRKLGEVAQQIDQIIEQARESRHGETDT